MALDSGAAGDCWGCHMVIYEEEKRHDNDLRSGRGGPHGSGNGNDYDRNNRFNDPARRSECLLVQGLERSQTLSPTSTVPDAGWQPWWASAARRRSGQTR